jgi:Zn-dependent protease with chaperone function
MERKTQFSIWNFGCALLAGAKFFSTHPVLEDRIAALRASGSDRQIAHQAMGS